MSAERKPDRRVDIVALIAGLVFVFFSVASLTVGVLDLPRFGAAPLWVILIAGGVVLLVGELRSHTTRHIDAAESSGSPEQAAWEPDPYR